MPENPPPDDKSSGKQQPAALEAVGTKTRNAKAGEVLTFEVKSVRKPRVTTSDNLLLHVRRRPEDGAWSASFVPTKAGDYVVTASLPDTDPVTFKVTATEEV